MDKQGSVSIIIPVRNGAEFILQTLETIAGQTYREFEVIVIDDGSTDETARIVRSFMSGDSRFRIVDNSGGAGHEHARNYGVSLARADWIAECDADDLWHEDKLRRQVQFRDSWSHAIPLVLLGTAAQLINDKGEVVGSLGTSPTTLEEYMERRARDDYFMLNHSSIFYERGTFMKVGGYKQDYIGAECTELYSRMAEYGAVLGLPERLFLYRKHLKSFMLANTITQEINFHRIRENIVRRRMGQEELTFDQFLATFKQKMSSSGMRRFNRNAKGTLYYRRGAISSVNGHLLQGLIYLAIACFYDFRKVWSGLMRKLHHTGL
ncbi:glycosyltransferase family 2 protein [Cohnella fermenti]|nr:glycosyltransferase family 2 protein [Cohnella fermenti]